MKCDSVVNFLLLWVEFYYPANKFNKNAHLVTKISQKSVKSKVVVSSYMIDLYTKQWLLLSVCHSLLINFGAYNFVIKNSTILAKNEEKTIIHILFPSRTKFQFFVPECNDPYNLPNVKHTRELFQTSLLSFQYWLCEKLLLERHPVPDLLLRMSAAAGVG